MITQTLPRNPSQGADGGGLGSAQARYPQAIAWDDPMATGIIGPASFVARCRRAYRLEFSQKVQFPGKRF